jgi:hypothetical protein
MNNKELIKVRIEMKIIKRDSKIVLSMNFRSSEACDWQVAEAAAVVAS